MAQVWWRLKAARAVMATVRMLQPEYRPGCQISPDVLEMAEALGIRPYVGHNTRHLDSTLVVDGQRSVMRTPRFVETEAEEPVIAMPPERKLV